MCSSDLAGYAIHGSPYVPDYPDSHGCVRLYPEDIRLYGLSFQTNIGSTSVAGELSYRPNMPLQINSTDMSIAAIYPNIWINDGMLMVETPFILVIALSLLFTYRLIERSTIGDVIGLSACLTVALMLRPEVGIVFPFFVAPFLLSRRNAGSWWRRIATVAIAAVIPIAAFAPWVLFNLERFENPVYLSTGYGQTLANANCDQTYSGDFLGYYKMTCIHDLVGGVEAYKPYDKLDGSVRDARLGEVAKQYVQDHASELPKVVAARVGRIWGIYRPGQSIVNDGWVEGRAGGSQTTDFTITRAHKHSLVGELSAVGNDGRGMYHLIRSGSVEKPIVPAGSASSSLTIVGPTTLHGLPAATEFGGTSDVTTDPAPTTEPSPMLTPLQIVTPVPMKTRSPIRTAPFWAASSCADRSSAWKSVS